MNEIARRHQFFELEYPFNLLMDILDKTSVVKDQEFEFALKNLNNPEIITEKDKQLFTNDLYANMQRIIGPRDTDIILERYVNRTIYRDIGVMFEKSPERIRQIIFRRTIKMAHDREMRTHFMLMELLLPYRNAHTKYARMVKYGELPYYLDAEKYFSKSDISEQTFIAIATVGITQFFTDIISENDKLRKENHINEGISTLFDIPNIPLVYLHLSSRGFYGLIRAGISSSRDVVAAFIDGRIYNIAGIGAKTILDIKNAIEGKFNINLEDIKYEINGNT